MLVNSKMRLYRDLHWRTEKDTETETEKKIETEIQLDVVDVG